METVQINIAQLVLPTKLYEAYHIHKPSPAQSPSYSQLARLGPGCLHGFRSAFEWLGGYVQGMTQTPPVPGGRRLGQ